MLAYILKGAFQVDLRSNNYSGENSLGRMKAENLCR
jgi:hypothetical protein